MKKIILLVSLLISLMFVSKVNAAVVLECSYGSSTSDNQGTLYVETANSGSMYGIVSVEYGAKYVHKRSNGKDVSGKVSNVNFTQWVSAMDNSDVLYANYIGDNLKCPKYVSSKTDATKTADNESMGNTYQYQNYYYENGISFDNGIGYYGINEANLVSDVYLNFDKDKATKRGNVATLSSLLDDASGESSGGGTATTNTKFCYYNIDGNKVDNNTEASLYVYSDSDKEEDVKVKGLSKQFKPYNGFSPTNTLFYAKDFIVNGKFTCVNKVYLKSVHAVNGFINNNIYVDYDLAAVDENESSKDFYDREDGSEHVTDEWLPNPDDTPPDDIDPCEVIDKNGSFYKILKQIIGYIQIGTIFIVILLSGLDFVSAITSGNDDAFKKATNKASKRIMTLVLVFLVPALVNLILSIVNIGACSNGNNDFISELFK